jgi:hypothetical protein
MASTPSMNPSQVSARQTESGARFDSVLFSTLDALEEAKIPFALIGGVAASGHGRPRSTHDIDVFVRPEDADATLMALEKYGFRTEKTDMEWLFKGFKHDILVDVIFKSRGEIYFDEEMQAHRKMVDYHGRKVPLVSPEDMAIIKCAVHTEVGPHHWHDALAILSHAAIDWNYLLRRARRAPRRLLALLIYAQSTDILIPNYVITSLYEYIFGDEGKRRSNIAPAASPPAPSSEKSSHPPVAPEYLVGHLRQALAEDPRTAQQDLKVLISGRQILVKGDCPSYERAQAVADVVRAHAPDYEINNQVRVAPMPSPERTEEIS